MSVITECLKDDTMRKMIVSRIGRIVRKEIRVLCSDNFGSVLKKGNVKNYSCNTVIKEMEDAALSLLDIFRICTQYKPRKRERVRKSHASRQQLLKNQQSATIAMCTAILCNYRCPAMSLLQKVISLILFSGSCSKIVSISI